MEPEDDPNKESVEITLKRDAFSNREYNSFLVSSLIPTFCRLAR